jgi:hypothetical protein
MKHKLYAGYNDHLVKLPSYWFWLIPLVCSIIGGIVTFMLIKIVEIVIISFK